MLNNNIFVNNINMMNGIIDTSEKSFLCNMKFKELVDTDICNALLDSDLLQENIKAGKVVYNEITQIKNLLRTTRNGQIKVSYYHSKDGIKNFGRINGGISLGNLRREVRGTLTNGKYIDIDIKNCHLEVANQLLINLGLNNKHFNRYCNNREDILKKIMKHHKVDRKTAKTIFYCIMYGGSYNKWIKDNNAKNKKLQFVCGIIQECKKLAEYLIFKNDKLYKSHKKKKEKEKQEWNIDLSFLSNCMQHIERKILEQTYTFFKNKNLIINNNCILCHDGIMLNIDSCSNELLTELSTYIKNNTGFVLTYEVKPLEHYLDIIKIETIDTSKLDSFDWYYFETLSSYELRKKYFEYFVCLCLNPKPHYLNLETKERNGEIIYNCTEISTKDINEGYSFLKYDKHTTDKNGDRLEFLKYWLKDHNKKIYSTKTFTPYNDVRRIQDTREYNLFNGYNTNINKYPMTYEKSLEIIKPCLKFIKEICEGNETCFNYFMKVLAFKIQYPDKRLPFAFILIGKQGLGKGMLNKMLCKVVGSNHVVSSARAEDFLGSYAIGLKQKLFVNFNESESKDNYNFQGFIKSIITDDYLTINEKYKVQYQIRNYAMFIFSSNKTDSVSIDAKSKDRRFIAFRGLDTYLGDTKYWNEIVDIIEKPEFSSAFYYYLNNIEVDDFNFHKERLNCLTDTYKELIQRNIPPAAQFMGDFVLKQKYLRLLNDELDDDYEETEIEPIINDEYTKFIKMPRYELYKHYKKWCGKNRPNSMKSNGYTQSNAAFYNTLRELDIPFSEKKVRGDRCIEYIPEAVYNHLLSNDWIV